MNFALTGRQLPWAKWNYNSEKNSNSKVWNHNYLSKQCASICLSNPDVSYRSPVVASIVTSISHFLGANSRILKKSEKK